jgi:hypothetical protein
VLITVKNGNRREAPIGYTDTKLLCWATYPIRCSSVNRRTNNKFLISKSKYGDERLPEVTSYANGVPSWVDIGTTDVATAEIFYSGVLGWASDRQPMGEGMVYSMQQVGGKNAAAIYNQREDQKAAGMPPMWLT